MTKLSIEVAAIENSFEVDFATLPESAKEFVIHYGLKQILNDSHVNGKTPTEKLALVEKKLAALRDGSLRIGAGRVTDPIAVESKRIAGALARKWAKKNGKKVTPDYYNSDEYQGVIKRFAESDVVREQASKNVRGLADLDELMEL